MTGYKIRSEMETHKFYLCREGVTLRDSKWVMGDVYGPFNSREEAFEWDEDFEGYIFLWVLDRPYYLDPRYVP